jgi:hypothetical protein
MKIISHFESAFSTKKLYLKKSALRDDLHSHVIRTTGPEGTNGY